MKIKQRKCKNCGTKYQPHPAQSSLQNWCSLECSHAIGMKAIARTRKKKAVVQRRDIKEKKTALKTRGQWAKEAQTAINRYVRARDAGKGCISCGALPAQKAGGTMDAGHYRTVGSAGHLRFNLYNINAQCVRCNRHLSGNVVEYRQGLTRKIGAPKVERLEVDNLPRKFDIPYLMRVKKIFTRRLKIIEARNLLP